MGGRLARRASIETTLGTYTDLRLFDLKGTVGRMPLPGGSPIEGTGQARSA